MNDPRDLAARRHRPGTHEELHVAVCELRDRGMGLETIARATDLSLESVSSLLSGNGQRHEFPAPIKTGIADELETRLDRVHAIDDSGAALPAAYEAALRALEQCLQLDECLAWDQAAALKSYARQVKDERLHAIVHRIQVRAMRRCGELLERAP